MSANEWADAVASALKKQAEKVPDGWKTIQEIMDMLHLSRSNAARKIAILKKDGIIEQRTFRIVTNRGLYPEIHFKLIKKK